MKGEAQRRDSETETVKSRENQMGKGWMEHLNLKSREETEKVAEKELENAENICALPSSFLFRS